MNSRENRKNIAASYYQDFLNYNHIAHLHMDDENFQSKQFARLIKAIYFHPEKIEYSGSLREFLILQQKNLILGCLDKLVLEDKPSTKKLHLFVFAHALNPYTSLGQFFWQQDGIQECKIKSGTLNTLCKKAA